MNIQEKINALPCSVFQKKWIENWIGQSQVELKLSRDRKTKLGDYRHWPKKGLDQISVNANLEPDFFFFTLTHEIAHYFCRKKYGQSIKPHGVEWKACFGQMIVESISAYSLEKRPQLLVYSLSPTATLGGSKITTELFLKKTDHVYLEEIAFGESFRLGTRNFLKVEKRKLRYLCKDKDKNKMYLVGKNALVEKIEYDR
ncbi:MAG: hypothetical protein C4K58_05085 [Flavobacteriaceae bacterium]|nr:MAG: hypothetical protein C4K58_05085 [Flavobacteriaceae bacterium]